jgi:hypothetical protein
MAAAFDLQESPRCDLKVYKKYPSAVAEIALKEVYEKAPRIEGWRLSNADQRSGSELPDG